MVTAKRNGQTRAFSLKLWNAMPPHKYGWQVVPVTTPREITDPTPEVSPELYTKPEKKKRHA